jgi:hypothetical protein
MFEEVAHDPESCAITFHEEVHDVTALIITVQLRIATMELARWLTIKGNTERCKGMNNTQVMNLMTSEIKEKSDAGLVILNNLLTYIQEVHEEAQELTLSFEQIANRHDLEQEINREHRN